MAPGYVFFRFPVIFFRKTGIIRRLSSTFDLSLSSLPQLLFKEDSVACVCFIDSICDIAQDRNKADDKVDSDIHVHLRYDMAG